MAAHFLARTNKLEPTFVLSTRIHRLHAHTKPANNARMKWVEKYVKKEEDLLHSHIWSKDTAFEIIACVWVFVSEYNWMFLSFRDIEVLKLRRMWTCAQTQKDFIYESRVHRTSWAWHNNINKKNVKQKKMRICYTYYTLEWSSHRVNRTYRTNFHARNDLTYVHDGELYFWKWEIGGARACMSWLGSFGVWWIRRFWHARRKERRGQKNIIQKCNGKRQKNWNEGQAAVDFNFISVLLCLFYPVSMEMN